MTDPLNEKSDLDNLRRAADAVPPYKVGAEFDPSGADVANDHTPVVITPKPFKYRQPASIPPREWLYGHHLSRRFISTTSGPGGMGKTSVLVADALALRTGRNLIGTPVYGGPKRVWYWSEDPSEEMERRVVAAMEHFGVRPDEVEGGLFIESFRTTPLCIVRANPKGLETVKPVVDGLVNAIRNLKIDVLIIDPFVRTHQVGENDNVAINAVAAEWCNVADRADCAIELAHHTKKLGGEEANSESLRGAKALVDAARSNRVLNRMTKQEAERAGLSTHERHFSAYDDKNNMTPRSEAKDWFEFIGVDLGNATEERPSDNVGVAVPWQWPNVLDDISVSDLLAVQKAIDGKDYPSSAAADDWAGNAVAEVLDLDLEDVKVKEKVKSLLKIWERSGALKVERIKDAKKGRERPVVRVGEWAISPTSKSGVGRGGESGE